MGCLLVQKKISFQAKVSDKISVINVLKNNWNENQFKEEFENLKFQFGKYF
jgi:hypothetical protein